MVSMENIVIEAIEKIEMKLKKRTDIERICDIANKEYGLDREVIANVVEKMHMEGRLKQKQHEKGPKSYKIEKNQFKDEVSEINQQNNSFLEFLDGVGTPEKCLTESHECQAQMDKLQYLADHTSSPQPPIQPSTNINCNEWANDPTKLSRCSAYDTANVTAHDSNTPGICSFQSIDINKFIEVIGKFADNENNLQEMLREQKIRNRIFQNTIGKLKDDNNKMATHIRELEITIESQKDAFTKCADHVRIVFNQLYEYLNRNSLLYKRQSGFRELFSTISCLLVNVDDWYNGIDTGHYVGSVFIDLKKAFDTVNQRILCEKLMHYGIQDREIGWFQSYLSNRRQFCRVDGVDSEIKHVKVGVPQGSCLGPLLFLVYVNDLPCSVKNSTVSMHADDTSLSYKSKALTQLNEAMNHDFMSLESWLKGNKISLNVAKTHTMLICSKSKQRALINSNEKPDIKVKDENLKIVEKIKYLGVQIDQNLEWKEHIKYVSSKVSRAIGFLKYSKNFITRSCLNNLYRSIVEPYFRYCCSVWGCCNSTEKIRLLKLQNRAARLITGSSFTTSALPLIEDLGWKTIEDLISYETQILVFKALNGLAPQYLTELFSRNSQGSLHTLRNTSTDLKLPLYKTVNGQKSFLFRGVKYWNSLPAESKQAVTLYSFKASL